MAKRHPNRSWRVDETYVRVAGNRVYLYRAVDSTKGQCTSVAPAPGRTCVDSGWSGLPTKCVGDCGPHCSGRVVRRLRAGRAVALVLQTNPGRSR
jgi:hypothetical protein